MAAAGFLLRGPMRPIVPDQMTLEKLCDNSGYRKCLRTWSRRRRRHDGVAILQAPEENCWTTVRLKLLRLLTNPSGAWSGMHGASSRTSEEARGIKEQCCFWYSLGQNLDDVGRQTKPGHPARAVMESFLVKKRWRCTSDPFVQSRRFGRDQSFNRVDRVRHSVAR